jgi:hypothetical protein
MKRFSTLLALIVLVSMGGTLALAHQTHDTQTTHPQQLSFDVEILVVDDFGDVDENSAPSSGQCVLTPTEQGFAIRGLSSGDSTDEMTHGELVVATLEKALEDLGIEDAVTVTEVSITSLDDDAVVGEIEDAIDESSADFVIVNMSFAFIPCELLEGMQAFGGEFLSAREARNLNRYRGVFQRAVTFYDNQVFPAMSQSFQNATDLHPIQDIFAGNANVIGVAASGNFGLDFPFWPGAFGQVLSVSASNGDGFEAPMAWQNTGSNKDQPLLSLEGQGNNQTVISNYGEVMIPGEFEVNDDETVIGTSFAAPRMSALLAAYVGDVGGNYCKSDGMLALITGDWDNLTLEEAVDDLCPAMGSVMP